MLHCSSESAPSRPIWINPVTIVIWFQDTHSKGLRYSSPTMFQVHLLQSLLLPPLKSQSTLSKNMSLDTEFFNLCWYSYCYVFGCAILRANEWNAQRIVAPRKTPRYSKAVWGSKVFLTRMDCYLEQATWDWFTCSPPWASNLRVWANKPFLSRRRFVLNPFRLWQAWSRCWMLARSNCCRNLWTWLASTWKNNTQSNAYYYSKLHASVFSSSTYERSMDSRRVVKDMQSSATKRLWVVQSYWVINKPGSQWISTFEASLNYYIQNKSVCWRWSGGYHTLLLWLRAGAPNLFTDLVWSS
jgi:hypothetical protein